MVVHVPVYALDRALVFPPPDHAVDGLVAVGGDLSPERLLLAYRCGIFPWYGEDPPIRAASCGSTPSTSAARSGDASRAASTRSATTPRSPRSSARARRCRAQG